jgi:hypothetical protein
MIRNVFRIFMSAIILAIPGAAALVHAAPIGNSVTQLTAISVSDTAIKLKWNVALTVDPASEFRIYRKAGEGTWLLLNTVGADITTYDDAGASGNTAATVYSYYIKTCANSACSDQTTAAIVPNKPANLKTTKAGGTISLAWQDRSANETGFQIFRKDGPAAWALLTKVAAKETSYNDSSITAGHDYSYKIRAVHKSDLSPVSSGFSSYSNISSKVNKTAIAGSVFCAPAGGASVSVLDSAGRSIAGPVKTANDGTFSLLVPTAALSNDLRIESRGGSYIDEATGNTTNAGLVGAYIPGGSLGTGSRVNLDPSSTIIYHMVTKYGKTLSDAETLFTDSFGYAPDVSVTPQNSPSAGDDAVERLAGLRAITFSQLTKDLGLLPARQFILLAAIARDLSDGVLDGMDDAAQIEIVPAVNMPEDVLNMFESALTGLLTNTSVNLTGLTPDQIGRLPFAKVALTDSYRVEYVPGMMPPAAGMTTFQMVITDLADGSPATGLAVSLMPMMHMATMGHSSPVGAVVEDNTQPGTYKCNVYYLMASEMSDGTTMGYWDLKVLIGGMMGESATFFPRVGMTMGTTTVRATLKGQSDTIAGMMGPEKRSYYIFNRGVTTTSFSFFIAAKESMMSFPAVSAGTVLHDASGSAWTVDPIAVSVSTDGSTWVKATDKKEGSWTASGLSGLSAGETGTIFVKVIVNGEKKTIDGTSTGGANGYAVFTVTP